MYGQTEASPRLSYLDPRKVKIKPGSVGKAIPGVRIKIVDEKGAECGVNEKGEVIAKGPNVMMGYWKNGKETKKALKNGWLYTGDTGYKDRAGDLFLTGRKKSFIKVGGIKADMTKAAHIIMRHPDVFEASIGDMPDLWNKRKYDPGA